MLPKIIQMAKATCICPSNHEPLSGSQLLCCCCVQAGKRQASDEQVLELTEEQALPKLLELAARFNQAAADLQFVGVCRLNKRRREAAVQRTFFAPEML